MPERCTTAYARPWRWSIAAVTAASCGGPGLASAILTPHGGSSRGQHLGCDDAPGIRRPAPSCASNSSGVQINSCFQWPRITQPCARNAGRRLGGRRGTTLCRRLGRELARPGRSYAVDRRRRAARAPETQAPVARRRLHEADGRVPVEAHELLALAPFHQHLKALDRNKQLESLHPFDRHAQRVIVAEIAEEEPDSIEQE